jgi:putative hemolysin
MHNEFWELIKIIVLLLFSAFFSSSESAFFSIDYVTKEKLKKEKSKSLKLVYKLISNPNRLLVTILVGNMFVNIFASSIASSFSINIFRRIGVSDIIGTTVAIWVMSIVIIIFGEIAPKIIAITVPLNFAKFFAPFLNFIIILIRPVTIVFQLLTDFITNKIIKYKPETIKEGEISSIIKIGYKEGVLDEKEKNIMENIIENINKPVSEIMIPKFSLFMANINWEKNKIISSILKHNFSRLIVYKNNRDNIIGIIRKKDVIPLVIKNIKIKNLNNLIKPVLFVPENKKINELLKQFQSEKKDFAIVVDEYGITLGAVSIENIIEAIMGKYPAYYSENNIVQKIGKNKYIISGEMKISEFNEIFKANLKSKNSDTIAGLIIERLEKIPKENEKILIDDFKFTIEKMNGPKIDKIILEGLS